jgi:hypothetical protein
MCLRSTPRGDQSDTCTRLSVLVGATRPCTWLQPCTRFGTSMSPSSTVLTSWRQSNMGGALACHTPPTSSFVQVFSSVVGQLQVCGALCDIASQATHSLTWLQVAFEDAGWHPGASCIRVGGIRRTPMRHSENGHTLVCACQRLAILPIRGAWI